MIGGFVDYGRALIDVSVRSTMPTLPDGPPGMPPGQPKNGNQPMTPDQLVPMSPVPTAYDLAGMQFNTPAGPKWFLRLVFFSPTGQHASFWDGQAAKRLAADIRAGAAEVGRRESGIIVATADQMPPDPPTTRR